MNPANQRPSVLEETSLCWPCANLKNGCVKTRAFKFQSRKEVLYTDFQVSDMSIDRLSIDRSASGLGGEELGARRALRLSIPRPKDTRV